MMRLWKFPRGDMKYCLNFYILVSCFAGTLILFYYQKCQGPLFRYSNVSDSPTIIYLITPTYSRFTQKSDLTKFRTAISYLKHVFWIVVEDSATKTALVDRFLLDCSVPHAHLAVPTPLINLNSVRGSLQRNAGIDWLRANRKIQDPGVVYFADDDNNYDPRIFEEMRMTKKASTWPVGLVGGILWEGCVTKASNRSQISHFSVGYAPKRKFPIDMASFAINLRLFFEYPNALFDNFRTSVQEGLILSQLGIKDALELEPKVNGCSKVLVWHVKTRIPLLSLDFKAKGELMDFV